MELPAVIVFLCLTLGNAKLLNSGLESSKKRSVGDGRNVSMRLAGGKSVTDGRLEIYTDGAWKWICSNNFTIASAQVVCRQMGFIGGKIDVRSASAAAADPSSASSMAFIAVACSGSESDLFTCPTVNDATMKGTAVDRCIDGTSVAVACSQDAEAVVGVRLGDSYAPGAGRLEVFIGDSWGTVCRDGFNDASARVACRQLGLRDGSLDNKTLTGFLPVTIATLICDGKELRLQDCRLRLSQQQQPSASETMANDCNNLDTVGIVCSPDSSLLLTLSILPHQSPSKDELNVAGLNGIFFFEVASGCASDVTLFLQSTSFSSRRPSSYFLKIALFRASASTKETGAVSAHVVWECQSEDSCTEIANVRSAKSSPVTSLSSCRQSLRPMVLLWRKGVGAVVVPHSSLFSTSSDELETTVQTLLQRDDQIVGWRARNALQEQQDFTHISLGSGSYELAVRIYRNSSWFVNRCLLREMEMADVQVCGGGEISKTLCLQCGCCFNPSSIPSCYFSRAHDVHASSPDSCIQKKFSEFFGRIVFMSDRDEVYRNDELLALVLLERTANTGSLEIQYNDESPNDVIKMADLFRDERKPLPDWSNRKLRNDPDVRKFYRIIRQHTYSKTGEYHVVLSITDPGNPEERILRNFVVLVTPRPPIPGFFLSIFFVNNGPVQTSEKVQVALIYQNSTLAPEFIVTVDMTDGMILNMTVDHSSPLDDWILNATGLEPDVGRTYYRGSVLHQYKTAGIFTPEASITSEKWSYPWEAFHVRTAVVVTCSKLEVNLKNMGANRNAIQAYPIDKFVVANLIVVHGCQEPIETGSRSVVWTAYPLQNLTSVKNESTRIRIPTSDSNPDELRIAPYALEPGFYIVQAQVTIAVDDSDEEEATDFVDESNRPMNYTVEGWIAIFTPTSSKSREGQSLAASINETVLVDMPRDIPKLQFLQVTTKPVYRWACLDHLATADETEAAFIQLKINQRLVESCFRPNQLPSGLSSQVLAFDANQLSFVSLPATFTFVWLAGDPKLETVAWGNRFVTIANDSRIRIDIVCHSNCAQNSVATDDREVILEVICARESCQPGDSLRYEWHVIAVDVNRSHELPVQVLARLDRPMLVISTKTLRREGTGHIYSFMVTVTKLRTGVFGSRMYRLLVDRQMAVVSGAGSWPWTMYYSTTVICSLLILSSRMTS